MSFFSLHSILPSPLEFNAFSLPRSGRLYDRVKIAASGFMFFQNFFSMGKGRKNLSPNLDVRGENVV